MTPPEPGVVLTLGEDQYRFGTGPVLCRVVEVIDRVLFDDVPWWHLRAECANGTPHHHGGWHPREVYVIASAVPGSSGTRHQ